MVVDADIDSFFDRLGHDLVLDCVRERVSDRRVLKLIRSILSAGVMDGATLSVTDQGAPQGGPLSPLMANAVSHRLDREWQQRYRRLGVLVRFADDLCICCPTEQRARAAMAALQELLGELGLALSGPKTQIVGVASGEFGFNFWGSIIGWWRPADIRLSATRRVGRAPRRWIAPGLGYERSPGAADAMSRPTCWYSRSTSSFGDGVSTFATATRHATSPSSTATWTNAWRCCSPNGTAVAAEATGSS